MIQQLEIQSEKTLDIDAFLQELDVTLTLEAEGTDAEATYYYLRRPDYSTSHLNQIFQINHLNIKY